MFLAVRARSARSHAVAAVAPERDVHLERTRLERSRRDLVEDLVRVEGPVVAADAGVVAPDNEMRAAVILAEERVQQRLARPGIAHVEGIACLQHGAGSEVLLDQHRNSSRTHLGWDIPRLE